MAKVTRTYGQFHFEDLDPHRFEDLIRGLASDFRDWQSIEATGKGGADDGIDIRAYEKVFGNQTTEVSEGDDESQPEAHPMLGRRWSFQCKREKEIGPKRLRSIVAEVDDGDPPYGYILAAPVNFSKTSYDEFRTQLIKKGVMEFYLWGRAELESMLLLPKNDRVLFTFFGISLVSKRRSRSTEIRAKVLTKNKLLRVFGGEAGHWPVLFRDASDDEYPFKGGYQDFNSNPRWQKFEARRIHPHGLIVRRRQWFAYLNIEENEYDFTEKVSLIPPHMGGTDHDEWELRRRDREVHDAVEDFWNNLPNRHKAELCQNARVKFEDMLVVDEKGIAPDNCPHIFVEFCGDEGPFDGSHEFFEVRRGYGEPDRIPADGFERVKIFPEEFAPPTIGAVHAEGVVVLDADTRLLLGNGNESIREFCVAADRYAFLKSRDVFVLKGSQREGAPSYYQVTHTYRTTVGDYCAGKDKEFRRDQLSRRLGMELMNGDALQVFEFKQTYDWWIERAQENTDREV